MTDKRTIFLNDRHRSRDADQRRAFAETYMALKEDAAVNVANETIVLTRSCDRHR